MLDSAVTPTANNCEEFSDNQVPNEDFGGGDCEVGRGWWRQLAKRGPLSSDLNKMAWICQSVYPAVWHTHTGQQSYFGRPLCFPVCFGYFSCGSNLELHFRNFRSLNS